MSSVLRAFLAQTAEPMASQSDLFKMLPILAIGVVFYFFFIRPQQKQGKAHQALVAGLKKGDEVVTQGGFIGTILSVDDRTVMIELGAGNRVRALKSHVIGRWVEHPAAGAKPGK
jgi:preprotein translocase subunit YajC